MCLQFRSRFLHLPVFLSFYFGDRFRGTVGRLFAEPRQKKDRSTFAVGEVAFNATYC